MAVQVKRAYDKASLNDGTRVLVDRLWPRGVSKQAARIDQWMRELAPSDQLRHWFHAHPAQWPLFRNRYLEELTRPDAGDELERLHRLAAGKKQLTLVFAARDAEHNNAVVLRELLNGMKKPPRTTGPAGAAAVGRQRARARR